MNIKNSEKYLCSIRNANRDNFNTAAFILIWRYEWQANLSNVVSFVFYLHDQGEFAPISLRDSKESDFKFQLRTYGFGVALGNISESDADVINKNLESAYGEDVVIDFHAI